MAAIIEVRDLEKTYQVGSEKIRALKNINFVVERGEFIAIMGQSGSGKSTLMNLLGCLDTPSAGKYFVNGR
jgi:putative ABC transport system ATP-binding protein